MLDISLGIETRLICVPIVMFLIGCVRMLIKTWADNWNNSIRQNKFKQFLLFCKMENCSIVLRLHLLVVFFLSIGINTFYWFDLFENVERKKNIQIWMEFEIGNFSNSFNCTFREIWSNIYGYHVGKRYKHTKHITTATKRITTHVTSRKQYILLAICSLTFQCEMIV